jgi:hypothetical protein
MTCGGVMRGNPKHQIPNPKEIPNLKHHSRMTNAQQHHLWGFDIGAYLELGPWDLELAVIAFPNEQQP